MSTQAHHIRRLASALTAGSMADSEAMAARARPMVGDLRKARWLAPLARKLSLEFGEVSRPTLRQVADRIRAHDGFIKAWVAGNGRISNGRIAAEMAPAAGAPRTWDVPEITTVGDLAETLRLHPDDLGWLISRARERGFASLSSFNRTSFIDADDPGCLVSGGKTEHYRHCWQVKPKSGRFRLIESPKVLLKFAQRQVLLKILHGIPPHEAARGFRSGCSILDFVEPHTGKEIVIRFDLEDFFPSISAARILRIYLTAGYPESVAQALTRLTTHAAPNFVLEERPLAWPERRRLATPHLPQGAPTSPALANLSAFRLDCRLAGLARATGAAYTRYADDLLFSGGEEFARQARRFEVTVGAIILEEGFRPNHHKTRILRQGQQQHAAGLILNEKPNIARCEFDRLKAILTNCVRHGFESQNRENHPDFVAHLQGKVAWVRFVHPGKGDKLLAIFERIDWG